MSKKYHGDDITDGEYISRASGKSRERIERALLGGVQGPSNGVRKIPLGREGMYIKSTVALDGEDFIRSSINSNWSNTGKLDTSDKYNFGHSIAKGTRNEGRPFSEPALRAEKPTPFHSQFGASLNHNDD